MVALSNEAREERNRYMREYRKNNGEAKKQANEKYWEKRAKQNKGEGKDEPII